MNNTQSLLLYQSHLKTLKVIVKEAEEKLLEEETFVKNNVNFFTKSFLIISCAYLESYIKEVLIELAREINTRLTNRGIPHNYIRWRLNPDKEYKDMEQKCVDLNINLSNKDLDQHISGNPYRTQQLFLKFGINLHSVSEFNNRKDIIQSIVNKRNKVVHYNIMMMPQMLLIRTY